MTSVRSNYSLRGSLTFTASGDFCYYDATISDTLDGSGHAAFSLDIGGTQAIEVYAGSFDNSGIDTEWRVWLNATGSDNKIAQAPTLGWYHFAVVRVAGVVTIYYRADAASSWSSIAAGTHTGTTVTIYWFSWTDGSTDAANVEAKRSPRLWTAGRDTTGLMSESRRSTPGDATNIYGFWPLEVYTALGDASGLSHNFTIVGTGVTLASQPAFPDDSASHDLGATGLSSTSERGTASIASIHVIAATGRESLSEIGAAALGSSTHDLGATGLSSTSERGTASIASIHVIGATGLSSNSERGSAAISSVHVVGATGLTSTSERGTAPIASKHVISATGLQSFTQIGPAPGQTTSVNANGKSSTSGYRIKRGNPSDTSDFFDGPSTFFVRCKVADWSDGPDIADIQNIIGVNYDGGGGDSHYGQLYNEVAGANTGKIRLYKGEGVSPFPVDPTIRSGAYDGWFIAGFRCQGELTDPLEFFFIADDEAPEDFQEVVMDAAGGLRQVYVFGQQLLPAVDEQCNQLYACTLVVSNRYWTNEEIIAQRFVDHPTITGSHVFSFLPMDDLETAHVDKSDLYGGAGTGDFEFGMLELGRTENSSPYSGGVTIGQVAALVLGGLSSNSERGSAAISSAHVLGGTGRESQSERGTATIASVQSISASGPQSSSERGTASIGSLQILSATGLSSTSERGTASIASIHVIGATGRESLSEIGALTFSAPNQHDLGATGLSSNSERGTASIASVHVLGGTGQTSLSERGTAPIASVHVIGAAGLTSLAECGSATIGTAGHAIGATGLSSNSERGTASIASIHVIGATGKTSLSERGIATIMPPQGHPRMRFARSLGGAAEVLHIIQMRAAK